jgi:hypothetical protein
MPQQSQNSFFFFFFFLHLCNVLPSLKRGGLTCCNEDERVWIQVTLIFRCVKSHALKYPLSHNFLKVAQPLSDSRTQFLPSLLH